MRGGEWDPDTCPGAIAGSRQQAAVPGSRTGTETGTETGSCTCSETAPLNPRLRGFKRAQKRDPGVFRADIPASRPSRDVGPLPEFVDPAVGAA